LQTSTETSTATRTGSAVSADTDTFDRVMNAGEFSRRLFEKAEQRMPFGPVRADNVASTVAHLLSPEAAARPGRRGHRGTHHVIPHGAVRSREEQSTMHIYPHEGDQLGYFLRQSDAEWICVDARWLSTLETMYASAFDDGRRGALDRERETIVRHLVGNPDAHEGLSAFAEKRVPAFGAVASGAEGSR
jgi:hypothetical protein